MEGLESDDMTTTLRSELAALQLKRDSLLVQLEDTRCRLRDREEKAVQLEAEVERLREQAARQNVLIASLRKRIQELEERERSLSVCRDRSEHALNTIQRENKYQQDKQRELERKVSKLELELNQEELARSSSQKTLGDFVRRIECALGVEGTEHTLPNKISGLVQEANIVKARCEETSATLGAVNSELNTCRVALTRATTDRDALQQQLAAHFMEIDSLRQEKERLEMRLRGSERELAELKEKLATVTRALNTSAGDLAIQGATINSLRDELKEKEEKSLRLETELRHLLESLAIILSSPTRFVESKESVIKEKLRDLINEAKEKSMQVANLQEKILGLRDQLNKLNDIRTDDSRRLRELDDERLRLEGKLARTEGDLSTAIAAKESLRRDKGLFVTFLERLARALNMEEVSREVGVELHTESILLRAEQLARLETDKILDKSAVVYGLQRRVRSLRDQLQRRDLHLDLLRRKLTLQEDGNRMKNLLQTERDDANIRAKKMSKQVDRLQSQLNEARSLSRDLKLQLTEAEDYKVSAIDRGRKLEDLEKRLVESEALRSRLTRKISTLKEQLRMTGESAQDDRIRSDGATSQLREELATVRDDLVQANATKANLARLRGSVCGLIGLSTACSDTEIISRISKLASATRDYLSVTRRYDEGVVPSPRYTTDDSGFLDPLSDDVDSDIHSIYNKRPVKVIIDP